MHELYRHYDAAGVLLYVGTSLSTVKRTAQHMAGAGWSHTIAKIDIERFPFRWLALEAEKTAIMTEAPLFNVTHNNRAVVSSPITTPTAFEPTTYQCRDPEKRKAYMAKYMRDRRRRESEKRAKEKK